LVEAIKNAGSADKDAIIDALANIDFTGVTGRVSYDGSGDPVKAATVIRIVDGKYTFFDRVLP
jgi:branched-chain amino acid transport system substrate-binding protein